MPDHLSGGTPRAPRILAVRRPGGRATVAAAAVLALTVSGALVARAAEDPRLEDLELTVAGGHYTAEALQRDSDGDGWTDWYERLQGTDPKDPKDHPGSTYLEVVDRSVFVQSTAFPDRLTVADLTLPEGGDGVQGLLALVTQHGGVSPLGETGKQLRELVSTLTDGGLLAGMLEQSAALHGKEVVQARTNGMAASLIGSGKVEGYYDGWNVQAGEDGLNGGWVRVNDATHMQYHKLGWDGLHSVTADIVNHDDGRATTYYTVYHNGKVVRWGYRTWDMNTGEEEEVWYDEATGKQISSTSVAPTATQQASTSATGTASPSSSGGSSPSPKPSEEPSGGSSPSASTTYGNPDVDEASVLRVPTAAEVKERLAFLSGVRARFGGTPPVLDTELVPEPGVADPMEPECTQSGCVFFVEVSAPRLGNVHGGCPVPPDLKP